MFHILAQVEIEDFAKFIAVLSTKGAELRRRHGNSRTRLFRVQGEERKVVAIFEWESKAAFEAFLADPVVKESMRVSGTAGRPEFTFLEYVGELSG